MARAGATGGWNVAPANAAGRFRTTPRASGDDTSTNNRRGVGLGLVIPRPFPLPSLLARVKRVRDLDSRDDLQTLGVNRHFESWCIPAKNAAGWLGT
jgi:hypothetical protein